MSSVSRRLLTYWLLLLVPTLLVGGGAFQLLRREQVRLADREAYAGEARRAAVAARAGLIVENAELLIGDVQTGLFDTLAAMPAGGLEAELALWQKNHPLVRTAFRCTPDGAILLPSVVDGDEEARGFHRRFAPLFEANPPWRVSSLTAPAAVSAPQVDESLVEERRARAQAAANVSKLQTARRDAQSLAQSKEYRSAAPPGVAADKAESGRAERVVAPERRGWTPWTADGRGYLVGWIMRPEAGEVRGVEIELMALLGRLAGVLPAETGAGEGYALRDAKGRIVHQAGWVPRDGEPVAVRVALAEALLPGWEVVGYLDAPAESAGGAGFFVLGSLLTGILLVAILAGGALLVSQARRSEAEAAQKTSFVANVSHEFKTPLTTIRLYAELLEQGRVAEAEKRTDYLRTIGRETQRLARLVGNALDFSRLEQGQKKYARERLELRAELARLLDIHAPRLAEAGLVLHRVLPEADVPVVSDRDALEQIVLNLLDNAVKYAAEGGEVTVELAARAEGGAVVRVLDRGAGVPAGHQTRIFDKFHRVDDALTAAKTGAGLGLSIARQLARGLGGELRYASRDGGGAAFILELP